MTIKGSVLVEGDTWFSRMTEEKNTWKLITNDGVQSEEAFECIVLSMLRQKLVIEKA